jgi:DNA modification methylase
MKILKGNFGEVRFIDNMNPDYGLPSLKEKSWDLCLTDPPYNLGIPGINRKLDIMNNLIYYPDNKTDKEYFEFSELWFRTVIYKINRLVFTPGYNNFKMWLRINDKLEWAIHYNRGRGAESLNCKMSLFEPILTLNVDKNTGKLPTSVFEQHGEIKKFNSLHPCPKNLKLWMWLFKSLNPLSIIDPFLGSGTTAQCCEEMGIPWLGYEIMEEYSPDIEKRIQLGMKSHDTYMRSKKVQRSLF